MQEPHAIRYNLSRLMTNQENGIEYSLCAQWVAQDPSFFIRTAKTLIRSGAQADLSLRWAHSHFVGFVMRRLICLQIWKHKLFQKMISDRIFQILPKIWDSDTDYEIFRHYKRH